MDKIWYSICYLQQHSQSMKPQQQCGLSHLTSSKTEVSNPRFCRFCLEWTDFEAKRGISDPTGAIWHWIPKPLSADEHLINRSIPDKLEFEIYKKSKVIKYFQQMTIGIDHRKLDISHTQWSMVSAQWLKWFRSK